MTTKLGSGILACAVLVVSATPLLADRCTRMLSKLEGWTIVSVTRVDGEFEGCDFDRVIRFQDRSAYECAGYGYHYAYSPDAVIFGKSSTLQGKTLMAFKALIDGEIYDMRPVLQSESRARDSVFVEYHVDLGLVIDFEDLRELIDGCSDLGTLERVRGRLESVGDLEELRPLLEQVGIVEFRNCPAGISGVGIRGRN